MRDNASVDIFYGSYDASINGSICDGKQSPGSRYTCIHIPNTGWAAGRNELARAVYQSGSATDYKYWLFLDEDACDLSCALCEDAPDMAPCCFDLFVSYLLLDSVQHASVGLFAHHLDPKYWTVRRVRTLPNGTNVTKPGRKYYGSPYAQLFWDCIDARIHAFHAEALPLFLPYFTQLENVSWHKSQALQFYVNTGCIAGATILLGGFNPSNTQRKAYPKARLPATVDDAILIQALPTLQLLLPRSPDRRRSFLQGNCGNLTTLGWQRPNVVLEGQSDSGWWRQAVTYQVCLGAMKPRFEAFMAAAAAGA